MAHRSYGLNVARLANLPAPLLELAKQKSAELEEKIRRKRLAGLISAVGEVAGTAEKGGSVGDEGLIERLISSAEQL